MTTQAAHLKKSLIKYIVISIVLLAVLAAAGYGISDYADQVLSEKQNQENENSKLHSESEATQALINNGSEASAFYNSYIKNHNSNFLLDREAVTQLLAELREKNDLVNLAVTVSPITPVPENASATLKTGTLIQSEVKLTFAALTDNSVYSFIEALERRLPGIVLVHDLKMTKTREMTDDVLRDLSIHKIEPLVTAELSFLWLGIRPNAQEKPDSGHMPQPLREIHRNGP